MKKFISLFLLLTLLSSKATHAQLEKVIVETYYISDYNDASDTTGGGIDTGSKTFRIYIDLVPGSQLAKIYGNADHAFIINSTATFFNNKADGQSFGKDFPKNRLSENTVALDTWLTLGQTTRNASKTYFGVLKANDNDGSFIGGVNNDGGSSLIAAGLLANVDPLAGTPLTTSDGMDTMNVQPGNWADFGIVNNGIDSTIFGSVITGSQFISHNASLQNSGVSGVLPDSNQVLVAQLTTKGDISFELNIEVIDTNGAIIKYVANDSIMQSDETYSRYLKYPYEQICGCPNPDYLEYRADRDCDNMDSCKTIIVFGCTDPLACNFDSDANFNLPELCCYPGKCNDRDISIVCPSITAGNREFTIYPNPAQNHLTLNIKNDVTVDCAFAIYDSYGNKVIENNIGTVEGTKVKQIDISSLENGLHLIRLFINDSSVSKIFLKQ